MTKFLFLISVFDILEIFELLPIPLSNWALVIGLVLIIATVMIRHRKFI